MPQRPPPPTGPWLPCGVFVVRHTLYLVPVSSHPEPRHQGQHSLSEEPIPVFSRARVDSKTLTRNTRIIAEALTRVIYNLTEKVSCLVLALAWCTQPYWAASPYPFPLQGTPPDMPVFTEQMVKCACGVGHGDPCCDPCVTPACAWP